MPTTDSPLRYPGGKTQLAPFVSDLLRDNDLIRGVYAEPFAGGAGIAWRLLFAGHVSEVWLNDIDPGIHSFWRMVLERPEDLCELIERTPVTIEQWHKQRKVLATTEDPLKLGFATLFLNRTNRSGIIAAGVIGGMAQDGSYKLDCRFNKSELIDKVLRIASHREVVKLSRIDAKLCIAQWSKRLPKRALMNIDPPYFAKGQELYTNFYQPKDHEVLARAIRRLQCAWMLTYDDVPEIEKLYDGLPTYRKALTYYAQVKRRANELLVLSPALKQPDGLAEAPQRAA
ncbi:MAG: DNA adenine methylase [Aquabacterium sp.]|nr:MAG: DNA adenine methylase [Aquabacterium sp.]